MLASSHRKVAGIHTDLAEDILAAVDAVVMASAARRGDVVYTSDFDDLAKLQRHFPSVRVLAV